jgi:tRNA(Ile)-lysidine synthase
VLAQLLTHPLANPVVDEHTLSLDVLLGLNDEVQTAVLRHWIREKGTPIPPRRRLQQFLDQLRNGATGANRAELSWAGQLMKRHQNIVWWHRLPCPVLKASLPWAHGDTLDLEAEFGSIQLPGSQSTIPPGWEVGPIRPGARMKLHAFGPRRKLIDLLRERGIPPWLRCAVPVLYWDGAAVALGDSVLEPRLSNWLSQQGASIKWHPTHPLLRKLKSVCTQPSERNNMQHE